MVNAEHSSGIGGFTPKQLTYGGEPVGYIITLEDGTVIYHAGDTDIFSDMKLIGELYKPDVALLPIGDVYTMGPETAVEAAKLINAKKVIPMHYAGSFQLPGSPDLFKKLMAEKLPETEVIIAKPGEEIEISK
jgi:L-ascorbate metabolism protein UlaG (beta-lactamase superfamily)